MAEYSDEEFRYANSILDALKQHEFDTAELEEGLVVSDLEADLRAFTSELEILEHFGLRVPALYLQDEEAIPVSLALSFGWPDFGRGYQRWWRRVPWLYEDLVLMLRETDLSEAESMSADEARTSFFSRASDFLATRIAAIREYFRDSDDPEPSFATTLSLPRFWGGPSVQTPGCHFKVTTNSNGLRVFWSGAYWITSNYFNHPTTPTSSVLQAGTYVFGVDGGAYGNQIQWDTNAKVRLPGQSSVHLNY